MNNYAPLYDKCFEYWSSSAANIYRLSGKTAESYAKGNIVVDEDGKEFLDFACSYGIFLLGHANDYVVEAATGQLTRLASLPENVRNPLHAKLLAALRPYLTEGLSDIHFAHSGGETCEMALRLVKAHHPNRKKIIVAQNSYHGKTTTALDLLGQDFHRTPFGDNAINVVRVPYNELASIRTELDSEVAAVFLEPVLGGPFITVPDDGYLQQVDKLCKAMGTLLIIDEIQTAFGRSGQMIECQQSQIQPDMLMISKGLTGGCTAMACLLTHHSLAPAIAQLDSQLSNPSAGQPLACATAIAAIEYIEQHNLIAKAQQMGAYLKEKLTVVSKDYPNWVLAVPGKALMTGLKCRSPGAELLIMMGMEKRGIHLGYSLNESAPHPVLRFYPSLLVTQREIDRVADALADVLATLQRKPFVTRYVANLLVKNKYRLPQFFYHKAGK
ncbi:aspartate aminotransferase family protein [Thalassotalea fusca]